MPLDSISSVLFSLYRGTPQQSEWMVACLEGAWPGLVGERVAKVCRPLALDEARLIVQITDPDWERAIKAMQAELLEKVRARTGGAVRRISFRIAAPSSEAG